MNDSNFSGESSVKTAPSIGKHWWVLAGCSGLIPWLSQPPLGWWPFAMLAVIPLLIAAASPRVSKRRYAVLYLAATLYWAITLQGLRHANPLLYPFWIVLAGYLAVYPIVFTMLLRRLLRSGCSMIWSAPLAWVGMECVRNYMLTGISAVMLGHALADVPLLIQIADFGGSYVLSGWVVSVNVALWSLWVAWRRRSETAGSETAGSRTGLSTTAVPAARVAAPAARVAAPVAVALVTFTVLYGQYRLGQPTRDSDTTIALIGRNEPVEYDQDQTRELELFDAYARESIKALKATDSSVDAVVWPESMFTGAIPWTIGRGGSGITEQSGLSIAEQQAMIGEYQRRFQYRAASLQSMLAENNGPQNVRPHLLGGCGIVQYGESTRAYSGMVHVDRNGQVKDWYGKTHLVMFGEYVPLLSKIPVLRNWIPQNMGLSVGEGPKHFFVDSLTLCPNICIETAVERVPMNHLRRLRSGTDEGLPDVIVTVTNDAWFDDSSVVQHHKRCAQLVAVTCRTPVLSAANNGPTVWIDSCGRVVQEVPQGGAGSVVANPRLDDRASPMMWIGDWPAKISVMLLVGLWFKRPKSTPSAISDA